MMNATPVSTLLHVLLSLIGIGSGFVVTVGNRLRLEEGGSEAERAAQFVTTIVVAGAGHNLPQEAPRAFADAILEVDGH
jgi:pimeloyl-ACP methyl ester carboxylesterase